MDEYVSRDQLYAIITDEAQAYEKSGETIISAAFLRLRDKIEQSFQEAPWND